MRTSKLFYGAPAPSPNDESGTTMKTKFFNLIKSKPGLRAGFTLPEVVITSLVIVVMMLPLSRLAYMSISNTRYARDIGSAVAVGQQKLEQFSEMDYEDIESGNDMVEGYLLAWRVVELDESKVVHLQVSWQIMGRALDINLNNIYSSNLDAGFGF